MNRDIFNNYSFHSTKPSSYTHSVPKKFPQSYIAQRLRNGGTIKSVYMILRSVKMCGWE